MIVSSRKSVVRIFKFQADKLIENGSATKKLEELIAKTKLGKKDFEQKQVTITKELNDKLLSLAAKYKTRRIVLIHRLGEEDLK